MPFFRRLAFCLCASFLFLVFSCASSKTDAGRDSFFYEENAPLFWEGSLSNGIPVVIKDIPLEKNIELRVLFSGGASSCPKGKSGLDRLTFDLIFEGNESLKERVSRGRCYAFSDCLNDYSYCGFSAAAEDFDESLDLFRSLVRSPQYSRDDYLKKEAEAAGGALARSESPKFALLDALSKRLYAASPYAEGMYYRPESRVSEYDIEKNLLSLLDASRMAIVAAGNFSYKEKPEKSARREKKSGENLFEARSQKLLARLEESFGGVGRGSWAAPQIPPLRLDGEARAQERSEFAGSDFYSALCLACPARGSEDYEAFALSTLALDSLLSRELVERQKIASYSGTAVLNGRQSACLIVSGGKGGSRDFFAALEECLKRFPDEYELEKNLELYKNIYISRVVGSSHNAGATLDQMASSLFYEGSASAFIGRPQKIRALSAEDVEGAFKKYFLSENRLFVTLSAGR